MKTTHKRNLEAKKCIEDDQKIDFYLNLQDRNGLSRIKRLLVICDNCCFSYKQWLQQLFTFFCLSLSKMGANIANALITLLVLTNFDFIGLKFHNKYISCLYGYQDSTGKAFCLKQGESDHWKASVHVPHPNFP